MNELTWNEFQKVDIRVGTVLSVEAFPQARKPAYIVHVDFGEQIGIKKTSAQITNHYSAEQLVGRQILGVVNFPPKQIGPINSEFLLTGFNDKNGHVVISTVERKVPNGSRLH